MAEVPRKRSRFDQTESDAKRHSRFDRRSRSPSSRREDSNSFRSRSPLGSSSKSPTGRPSGKDPASIAAAAAAKINAEIQSKKGIQHVDVPPVRSASVQSGGSAGIHESSNVNGDIYQQDGDYIKDIEVNDLRNRYTLTKGATQKMIKDETGADVTTRGNYYPDKSMATPSAPPLYLHVTSQTKEGLEKAVAKIDELMKQELPNLVDERRFRRREPEQVERDEHGRRKWPEEKIPIDLEPIPGFNLRAQVVGHGGAYVKHIQQQTRCRVQIKGRGSGFFDQATNQETDEPMYLHVAGPDASMVQQAKELCLDLLGSVREQYQSFKERGGQRQHRENREGGSEYNRDYHNGRSHQRQDAQNSSYGGYASQQPAMSPAAQGAEVNTNSDWASQYSQYYNGQDPYAAYGGYQNYVALYYQYYQQQQQDQGTPPVPGSSSTPITGAPGAPPNDGTQPPPPPSEPAPPPPPPPTSGSPPGSGGGYSAVPPPPGM